MFTIALSDEYGNVFSEEKIEAIAKRGRDLVFPKKEEMTPLPPFATITMLPHRVALGKKIKNKKKGKIITIEEIEKHKVFPTSCILPPGYTRTLLPAYETLPKAPKLPFFAYTFLAWKDEELYCGAICTHKDIRWNPAMYNSLELPKKIKLKKKKHPKNRLLNHLEKCALNYRCFTAQNIFYERWEGAMPTTPSCNAKCMGCISQSHIKNTPSPQNRISFIPTVEEIVEISVSHLENPEAIISFGQGCEGEPLLQGDLIEKAISQIRNTTDKGTININTNGSLPNTLKKLFEAGLDSARISLNSAIEDYYKKYYTPQYPFKNVVESIDIAINMGKFVSLNYLFMPGVNDREEEVEALLKFLNSHKVNMIQIRNLNMDPDIYFSKMKTPKGKSIGVVNFINLIKKEYPEILIGNFSIPVKK